MTATSHHDVTDETVTDETVTDETTVTVTVALDDVVELFGLLALCRALCQTAPDHINAAMAEYAVNDYDAAKLGADLEAAFRGLYQAVS